MDMSVVAVIILCVQKDDSYGIVKLFEGSFHQGIKLRIIYFSLPDISIRTVIILSSIHLILPRYFTSKLTF